MNSVVPISQADQRLEAASRWILKLDEGISPAERVALDAWLAEHSAHPAALLEVAKAWDKLDSLERLADLFPHAQQDPQARPGLWQRRSLMAVAASLLVLVSAAYLLLPRLDLVFERDRPPVTALQSAAYETAIGEQKTVLLPDGSEVVLNTNSQLLVVFTESARVLTLSRGEIHVSVAEDRARPLSVVAGDRIVQAVGTEFTVEITEEDTVDVFVTEGKVVVGVRPANLQTLTAQITDNTSSVTSSFMEPPLLAQSEDNVVEASEEVLLGGPEETVVPVAPDEIEVKLSWKEGRLIFRSEPLAEALAEVERYTTVEFVLLDENLKTRTLSGRFRAGDVEVLLASLELNLKIAHEYDDQGRVLLSSL